MKQMLYEGIGKRFNIRLTDSDFLYNHLLVAYDELGAVFQSEDGVPIIVPWTSVVFLMKNLTHEPSSITHRPPLPPST
jgi:hypothetical protein